MPEPTPELFDKVVNLCKRRGFVFPSAEIYGGFRSTYDYGPVGVLLLRNVKDAWWRSMVQLRHDVVGLDASILSPPAVWEASGHLANFTDPLVDCTECKTRHRLDKLEDPNTCPECGKHGTFTEARQFNLMFKTHAGPVEGKGAEVYLRPETAQGMFLNFKNILETSRKKPPFGIAQIGKSFRNEITPGNFIFRTREFEQMEMEFFVEPGTDAEWHEYWLQQRWDWYVDLGIDPENLRFYEHPKEKLSHYSKRTVDIEYRFRFAGSEWGELEGVANRTDFDLSTHSQHSGQDLSYFDQAANERYTPYVIEPAAGLSRSLMTFLVDAYAEDEAPNAKGGVDKRTLLRLDPRLAPVKAAVLPLSRNSDLSPRARDLAAELRRSWNVDFDDAGAIGRRYRRQDEIGTPFCITVDFDSLQDDAVTVRDRDTMTQDRVPREGLHRYLADRLHTA
ncbi:MAG TPA: glycine--tRNA ligase [Nocardioides sp.]|nr:glycine--tRNA ligase [Nocardioides sp.]